MNPLLQQLARTVELGKVNASSAYPPDLQGQVGADELTQKALAAGCSPQSILDDALMLGMSRVGEKFRLQEIFVPDVLMAAKAMGAAMEHLKPYFKSAQVQHRGAFIIGTVRGDLHDIGKRLVGMVAEGAGWEVIDLGTDVSAERFLSAVADHPGATVGISALLTTTMVNMEDIVRKLKTANTTTRIIIGGAPLSAKFAARIGADGYAPDPQGAVEFLNGSPS